MKNFKKMDSKRIKNIVKDHFLGESTLPENKIDEIIKEYLLEREEMLDVETIEDEYEFSPKTKEAISDMVDGIKEMLDDLEIIKEKEGNVLISDFVYADEYLENVIDELSDITVILKQLTELKNDEEENLDL